MAQKNDESSMMTSLQELLNFEDKRLREEEAQKEAKAKADLEARRAQELAEKQAEERRIQEEMEARHMDEVRKKEEATRLEAIRAGELEKARAEADQRARMQQMSAQQAHEQTLAALTQDKHKKRLQVIVGVAVALLLIVGVGGGIAFKQHQDESAKRAAILEAQRKDTEERLRRLQSEFDMANRKEQELQASLANAKDEATRAKLQAELDAQKKATQAVRGAIKGGGEGKKTKSGGNCSPGDPLCD
jgi:colicin import membrane protein